MKKMIKRSLAVLLAVLLLCGAMPLTVFAAETGGSCGSGVYWSFDEATGTLSITGSGKGLMDNFSTSDEPGWETEGWSDQITGVTIEGVLRIGNYAFYGLQNLRSVTMDGYPENIGSYAFSFCTSLTELTFPENLDSIGQYCFKESGIKKLTFTGTHLTTAAGGNRQAFKSLSGAEIYVPEGFTLGSDEADPGKYGSLPFYQNYVGFTDGSKASVYWKDDDGSVLKGEAVEAGETPSYSGETPTKADGSALDGWTPAVVTAEANRIYYYTATYKTPVYTVTWENWDGTVLETDEAEYGATPSYNGETPVRTNDTPGYYYSFDGWTTGDSDETVDLENETVTADVTYTAHYAVCSNDPVPYVNARGEAQASVTAYETVNDTMEDFAPDGNQIDWWIVKGEVTNQNRLAVNGDVNLILCDGAKLTVPAGIAVNAGGSLTVWQQKGGTGALSVTGAATDQAGIGGDGAVIINGGKITANGGQNGAGIGGGYGTDGNVTVNGGNVTANGGQNGAGIGGGSHNGCSVTITGGTVNAAAGSLAAGIGSGNECRDRTVSVSVSGGAVTATGGTFGSGIGLGPYARDNTCSVTISGGAVSATGGTGSFGAKLAGIGTGSSSAAFQTTLTWTDDSKDTMSVSSNSYDGTVTLERRFKDENHSFNVFDAGTVSDNSALADSKLTPASETAWQLLAHYLKNAKDGETIKLTMDCKAGSDDTALVLASGKRVTLDLNGHTIDRGLDSKDINGSVLLNHGDLTITGNGVITGGYLAGDGGAIINNGTLTVNGGTFCGNKAARGGAVMNNSGKTLTINGGAFTGNAATDSNGGAVFNKGTMVLNGGTIAENAVSVTGANGGGIYSDGTLTINGGSVTGNASKTGNGGGVYVCSGSTAELSGSPVIRDNIAYGEDNDLYIDKNQNSNRIHITDALDPAAEIGIREETPATGNAFTQGLNEKGTAAAFFSDYAACEILTNNDGEAYTSLKSFRITIEPAKHGTVTADQATAVAGETVTLTVTPDAGCVVKSVSVNGERLKAENGVYSFTMPAEDVTVTAAFDFENGVGAELVGYSLSLDGDIGVKFYMELSDDVIAHQDTAYMHFTIPKDGTPGTMDILVRDADTKTINGKVYYIFKCGVAAKEIDSAITAQLFDGDWSSERYTYSVRQYADYLLAHLEVPEYAEAETLVRAMLAYGDNAKYYFNKTTEKPGDIAVTIPEYTRTIHDSLPSYATFTGATLSLKSETTLSLYFESRQKLDLTCEGQTVEKASSGNEYVIRIRNIAAAELNKSFTVKVDGKDAVTYSPLTYCYKAQQTSKNAKLVNTVKALYLYWQAADDYFD